MNVRGDKSIVYMYSELSYRFAFGKSLVPMSAGTSVIIGFFMVSFIASI